MRKARHVAYQVTQRLRDKTCTVIVSAKSGGKKVETHWTFKIDDGSAPAPPTASAPSRHSDSDGGCAGCRAEEESRRK